LFIFIYLFIDLSIYSFVRLNYLFIYLFINYPRMDWFQLYCSCPPSVPPSLPSFLQIFRDNGHRKDRQKARLLWLIEEWGLETFRQAVLTEMQTNAKYGVGAGKSLPVDGEQHHTGM
jgi:hypothetical protein